MILCFYFSNFLLFYFFLPQFQPWRLLHSQQLLAWQSHCLLCSFTCKLRGLILVTESPITRSVLKSACLESVRSSAAPPMNQPTPNAIKCVSWSLALQWAATPQTVSSVAWQEDATRCTVQAMTARRLVWGIVLAWTARWRPNATSSARRDIVACTPAVTVWLSRIAPRSVVTWSVRLTIADKSVKGRGAVWSVPKV